MPSGNAQQFEDTLSDVINTFATEGVYDRLEQATGLTMTELEQAAQVSPNGAAPVAHVDAGLAFAAGLLVGIRHSEWQG